MTRHERILRVASLVARHSPHPRFRIGAVLAKGHCIISTGVNKEKTHPRQINAYTGQHGCSIHAELDAVIGLSRDTLRNSSIHVARILASGDLALARPCPSCLFLLEEVGVGRIIYTVDNLNYNIEKVNDSKQVLHCRFSLPA